MKLSRLIITATILISQISTLTLSNGKKIKSIYQNEESFRKYTDNLYSQMQDPNMPKMSNSGHQINVSSNKKTIRRQLDEVSSTSKNGSDDTSSVLASVTNDNISAESNSQPVFHSNSNSSVSSGPVESSLPVQSQTASHISDTSGHSQLAESHGVSSHSSHKSDINESQSLSSHSSLNSDINESHSISSHTMHKSDLNESHSVSSHTSQHSDIAVSHSVSSHTNLHSDINESQSLSSHSSLNSDIAVSHSVSSHTSQHSDINESPDVTHSMHTPQGETSELAHIGMTSTQGAESFLTSKSLSSDVNNMDHVSANISKSSISDHDEDISPQNAVEIQDNKSVEVFDMESEITRIQPHQSSINKTDLLSDSTHSHASVLSDHNIVHQIDTNEDQSSSHNHIQIPIDQQVSGNQKINLKINVDMSQQSPTPPVTPQVITIQQPKPIVAAIVHHVNPLFGTQGFIGQPIAYPIVNSQVSPQNNNIPGVINISNDNTSNGNTGQIENGTQERILRDLGFGKRRLSARGMIIV